MGRLQAIVDKWSGARTDIDSGYLAIIETKVGARPIASAYGNTPDEALENVRMAIEHSTTLQRASVTDDHQHEWSPVGLYRQADSRFTIAWAVMSCRCGEILRRPALTRYRAPRSETPEADR